MVINKIKDLAGRYKNQIIEYRNHLHAHPELSFKEYQTSAFVEEKLRSFGITNIEKKAGTGLVALIEGKNAGKKIIALRADMDALPILEANEVPYKSKNEGVMHACGHDGHTVMLLAAEQTMRGAMTVGDLVLVNSYVIQICLPLNALGSLDATPHPDRLNLVYTEDGFGAGDLFPDDLERDARGVPLARQHADQPSGGDLMVEARTLAEDLKKTRKQ